MPLTHQQALHHVEQQPAVLSDFQITLGPETRNIMYGLLEALQASGFVVMRGPGSQPDYLRGFIRYLFQEAGLRPREANPGFFTSMSEELASTGYGQISANALKHTFLTTASRELPIRSDVITDYAHRYYEDSQRSQANAW